MTASLRETSPSTPGRILLAALPFWIPAAFSWSDLHGGWRGWLTWLWPPLGSQTFLVVALFAIVGTIATTGWLFIRGVDDAKWQERAALAATSIWR